MRIGNRVQIVRYVDGKLSVKLFGMHEGQWLQYDSRIDSLIAHIQREFGKPEISLHKICINAGLDRTRVAACQKNLKPIPAGWFLTLHDFTGMPIEELRQVAHAKPTMPVYRNMPRNRRNKP